MRTDSRVRWLALAGAALMLLAALSACGGAAEEPAAEQPVAEEEHMEEDEDHAMEDAEMGEMEDMEHEDVPDDAAAVQNPIEASDESVAAGADLYATNCGPCHGENGEGDGAAAAGLDPAPADLHEDHVQANSDGALFYIISNGVEGTAMPAWEATLSEDERWNLVNFIRTFGE